MPYKPTPGPLADRAYLNLDEAARYFAISTQTLRRLIRFDRLPDGTYVRFGSALRFNRAAIEEHFANGGRIPTTPTGDTAA